MLAQKKQYRIVNKEKISLRDKASWEKNKDRRLLQMRIARKARGIIGHRKYSLKTEYGLSLEQYIEIYNKQNGRCAICDTMGGHVMVETANQLNILCVDHCHVNNAIRGLLCHKCNKALGLLQDKIHILRNAINYLEQYKQCLI